MLSAQFAGNCSAVLEFNNVEAVNSPSNIYLLATLLARILGQGTSLELSDLLKFQVSSSNVYSHISSGESPLAVMFAGGEAHMLDTDKVIQALSEGTIDDDEFEPEEEDAS